MIWNNRDVGTPYRQNLYIFSASDDSWANMDQFEPQFIFAWNIVMSRATFGWSSRA